LHLPTLLKRSVTGYPAILNLKLQGKELSSPKGCQGGGGNKVQASHPFPFGQPCSAGRNVHSSLLPLSLPMTDQLHCSRSMAHFKNWQHLLDPTNSSSTPVYTPLCYNLLNICSNHGLHSPSGVKRMAASCRRFGVQVSRIEGWLARSGSGGEQQALGWLNVARSNVPRWVMKISRRKELSVCL
jgi:hypothetical protein